MNRNFARSLLILSGASIHAPVAALNFEYGAAQINWNTKLTVGAAVRTSARDDGKIGKLNIPGQQNLCNDGLGGGDDCISLSGDPEPNQRLINARGGFFAGLLDDGNLNYDQGDLVAALVKINTQLNLNWKDVVVKLNYIGFYDDINDRLDVHHVNTQYQPAEEGRLDSVRDRIGLKGELREAFVLYNFAVGGRSFSASVGNQRLRWGEANLHLFNTLDAINPLDAVLPLQPGFNLTELNVPTGMALLTGDIVENLSFEALYQYDWDTTRIQPSGSFFSSADPVGIDQYALNLSLGQFPEDPDGRFVPGRPFGLISSSGRTSLLEENAHPARDGGQYGLRLNWYAPNLNDGTEFGFYYLNSHSRLPYFSIDESAATCLRRSLLPGNFVAGLVACAGFNGTINPLRPSAAREPVPADTAGLRLDYPEDIHLFGVSFNTTAFGWAVSGEYAYRPNLPAQILITDVFFAGLQQSFGTRDIPLDPLGIQVPDGPFAGTVQSLLDGIVGGVLPGISVDTIIPGAETFIPSVLTKYRGRTIANGNEYQPGEYVRGYERLKIGQFVINALKLFPGTWGSDDVTVLGEFGFTHVIDMPRKGELYFQGRMETTHPGPGADCSGFPDGTRCNTAQVTARVNPTQQTGGFADDFAMGVRLLLQFNYSNVLNSGVTLKPTLLWFEDLVGIAPFPMQNYVEGNRWMIPGIQFEIGQAFNGTILYQYFDGKDQVLQDRDNISASLTYNF